MPKFTGEETLPHPELFEKYDRDAVIVGYEMSGEHFLHRLAELDSFDPEWAESWLTFVYGGVYSRAVLDPQTRALNAVAVHTVLRNEVALALHIRSAIQAGTPLPQIRESILQTSVYVGFPVMHRGLAVLSRILQEDGLSQN